METYLRFAAKTDRLPNHFFTKAYDERILFILSGYGELRLEDRIVPIEENTLCYYPAGTAYYPVSLSDKPMTFITLNFDFTRAYETESEPMPPVRSALFDPALAHITHEHQPYDAFRSPLFLRNAYFLRDVFLGIESDFSSETAFGRQKAEARLVYALCSAMEGERRAMSRVCEEVVRYLNEHYLTVRSNEEVATRVNYNAAYINKVLRKECGCSMHRYVIRLRLCHAASLLRSTDLSVERIAEESGFVNAKHFSTLFSAHYGLAPSAYRRGGQWI